VLVYSASITPRLKYIVNFFASYYKNEFIITDNKAEYLSSPLRLNYSETKISNEEIWIKPHSLLFKNDIKPIPINCFEFNGSKAFFKKDGDFPFDIFAACFYLLSRYEEYLPHQKDEYGRYAHQNSLAFKEGFLQLPLVNIWLEEFRKTLASDDSRFPIHDSRFQFIPTYDIDIAWSYKNKGFFRNAGGLIRSMVSGQWSMVRERINVLRGNQQDPYDAYQWMDALHEKYNLNPVFFFHTGQVNNKYDKNISTNNRQLQHLIRSNASKYKTGLHPSWHSGDASDVFQKEKNTLEKISGSNVDSSRQHFIRFKLPDTFRNLLQHGITNEFSIGYGSINGFRASVTTPFYWYDLQKEEQTELLLYPFCFMDANSFFEQKLSPEQAFDELMQYYRIIKSVNGTMITIWHNTFLGTDKLFEGWRETYAKFIASVCA